MTSFAVAALLQASLLSTGGQNYTDAYRENQQTGRPLVVLVGADWCPACRQMKQTVIPQLQQQGVMKRVAFATIDTDAEPRLARKLMRPGVVPQLIMFRKTATGWARTELIGGQSPSSVASFISRGLRVAPAATAAHATESPRVAQGG